MGKGAGGTAGAPGVAATARSGGPPAPGVGAGEPGAAAAPSLLGCGAAPGASRREPEPPERRRGPGRALPGCARVPSQEGCAPRSPGSSPGAAGVRARPGELRALGRRAATARPGPGARLALPPQPAPRPRLPPALTSVPRTPGFPRQASLQVREDRRTDGSRCWPDGRRHLRGGVSWGSMGGPESDTKLLRGSTLWVWTDFCIPHLLWIPRLQEDFQD